MVNLLAAFYSVVDQYSPSLFFRIWYAHGIDDVLIRYMRMGASSSLGDLLLLGRLSNNVPSHMDTLDTFETRIHEMLEYKLHPEVLERLGACTKIRKP